MYKVLLVFGTRPEAIKLAPVIKEFQKHRTEFELLVCVTGQHREMLDQVLMLFNIEPHYDLNIMKPGQGLFEITTGVLQGMKNILVEENPDLVMVHGDTTTSAVAALAAFYQKIPVAHVEAGLRTQNIYSPWPEEMNRQITGRIASYHFTPTALSKQNLLKENISEENIQVTGNTVIDALFIVLEMIKSKNSVKEQVESDIFRNGYDLERLKSKKLVLITGHRRENFGEGFLNICRALNTLSEQNPDIDFVYPMHLNPNVRKPISEILDSNDHNNLFLIEPMDYLPFIYLMSKSFIILTDSGGIQEEGPSLGKPVLVMRNNTERPEALEAGTVELVGTDYDLIVEKVSRLINDESYYNRISKSINPYGDGLASERIIKFIIRELKKRDE